VAVVTFLLFLASKNNFFPQPTQFVPERALGFGLGMLAAVELLRGFASFPPEIGGYNPGVRSTRTRQRFPPRLDPHRTLLQTSRPSAGLALITDEKWN
jgi:hypothetical protein